MCTLSSSHALQHSVFFQHVLQHVIEWGILRNCVCFEIDNEITENTRCHNSKSMVVRCHFHAHLQWEKSHREKFHVSTHFSLYLCPLFSHLSLSPLAGYFVAKWYSMGTQCFCNAVFIIESNATAIIICLCALFCCVSACVLSLVRWNRLPFNSLGVCYLFWW